MISKNNTTDIDAVDYDNDELDVVGKFLDLRTAQQIKSDSDAMLSYQQEHAIDCIALFTATKK